MPEAELHLHNWQATRQQLQAILSSLDEGLVVLDLEGRALYLNPAALRMREQGQMREITMSLEDYHRQFRLHYLSGEPVPDEERPTSRLLRRESFTNLELRVVSLADGEQWIGSWSGTFIEDGQMLGIITIRDITATCLPLLL